MYLKVKQLLTVIFFLISTFSWMKINGQSMLQHSIRIDGEVMNPISLTVEDLRAMPKSSVKVKTREKKVQHYEGVALHEVLKRAGVTLGEQLRGENLVKYVLVRAVDGYEVLFSLAETDPAFVSKKIILAYQLNGAPLPPGLGPFRMIVPDEQRQARWIREIRSIHIAFHQ